MSFEKILNKAGIDVTLRKVSNTETDGYLSQTTQDIQIKAIVLPLSSTERSYWPDAGTIQGELKAYVLKETDVKVGDILVVQGFDCEVREVLEYSAFKKLILKVRR